MTYTNFLLYLKAMIWSVFAAYSDETVAAIGRTLEKGEVEDTPLFRDTHLGKCLKFLLNALPEDHRRRLAQALPAIKQSEASMIYRNMVIEVGHYVTAEEPFDEVPDNCPGVISCIKNGKIDVLFCLPGYSLVVKRVHPSQVLPIYTLTIDQPPS